MFMEMLAALFVFFVVIPAAFSLLGLILWGVMSLIPSPNRTMIVTHRSVPHPPKISYR